MEMPQGARTALPKGTAVRYKETTCTVMDHLVVIAFPGKNKHNGIFGNVGDPVTHLFLKAADGRTVIAPLRDVQTKE